MKQYEAVVLTLEKLGGVATLGDLNQHVFEIKNCDWKTKTPFASIRRIVQTNAEIYRIKPGLYGLKRLQKNNEDRGIIAETEANKDSRSIHEFNHSYYQGLLLIIGNLKGLHTFVPNQDKNKKFYDGKKLGEIRNLQDSPHFSFDCFVQRSSTIDVVWFNERKMPHSFFEVEHSTDIQNSLLKFNDLQDFNSRMVIVADMKRKEEYSQKIKYTSFKELAANNKLSFLDYAALSKQYEAAVEQQGFSLVL